ncbi:conserved hypothetical protein [uncultured Gammaproteobacteria bacterium]
MIVVADGHTFDFTDAIDAFVFDEKDKSNPRFHDAPMKAVDIVAEFEDAYLFIEIKEYGNEREIYKSEPDKFKWLKGYLKYKFRDTYLFRHAEGKVEKPIHYVCLLDFDNALNITMRRALRSELPVGKKSKLWHHELATSLNVVDLEGWNRSFPKWPASRNG